MQKSKQLRTRLILLTVFIFTSQFGISFAKDNIIGGEDIERDDYPFKVGIEYLPGGFCGGTLLSNEWVLTAGHCILPNSTVEEYQVVINEPFTIWNFDERDALEIVEIIIHPFFDSDTLNGDIALLRIAPFDPADYNAEFVELAAAPSIGSQVTNIGWGVTNTVEFDQPIIMQKAITYIIENVECKDGGIRITTAYICTLNQIDQTSSCFGDSGSPLLHEGKQIGIVSTGVSSDICSPDLPQVYTDIVPYVSWIMVQVNGGQPANISSQYLPLTTNSSS